MNIDNIDTIHTHLQYRQYTYTFTYPFTFLRSLVFLNLRYQTVITRPDNISNKLMVSFKLYNSAGSRGNLSSGLTSRDDTIRALQQQRLASD